MLKEVVFKILDSKCNILNALKYKIRSDTSFKNFQPWQFLLEILRNKRAHVGLVIIMRVIYAK